MRVWVFSQEIRKVEKSFKIHRRIRIKICFSTPNAAADRRQSSTFQMFQCDVCLVLRPNRGYCELLGSFQLLVSPDMSWHQSRNTCLTLNLPSEPFPQASTRRQGTRMAPCTLPSRCKGIHHCTVSLHVEHSEKWRWALHARAKIAAARSPRSLG